MSSHTHNLRSRLNGPAVVKASNVTPTSRATSKSPRKQPRTLVSLELDHVIGTTTRYPTGLSTCLATDSFVYCAGSVAVLAHVASDGTTSRRFYRARPTAKSVNDTASSYETPTSTPTKKVVSSRPSERGNGFSTPRGNHLDENDSFKTWSARERIKTATSVSLSANGRFLAVGETGYHPRVLLFSTAPEANTELPLSIMTEHTWGVRSVAFSPDSKYLATLGEANDGYLFIWSIHTRTGAAKLLASNKCIANICHMAWCGQRLITVGTRHVKIWQLPDSEGTPDKRARSRDTLSSLSVDGPVPLVGRNCLLGENVNCTFTCVVSVNERYALICTDTQQLCAVDMNRIPAELVLVLHNVHLAGAMAYRTSTYRLVWAGGGQKLTEIDISDIISKLQSVGSMNSGEGIASGIKLQETTMLPLRQLLGNVGTQAQAVVAMECLPNHTITIDTNADLAVHGTRSIVNCVDTRPSASHNEPVQGVQALPRSAGLGCFFTWSRSGEVRFWGDGAELKAIRYVELDDVSNSETTSNEMKVIRYSRQGVFICGDRFGVLRAFSNEDWRGMHEVRAHSAEINDICLDDVNSLVATCSRDRTVQVFLFNERSLELMQTSDDHIAAVNQLLFSSDGEVLLSCSADRTIVVREKVSKSCGPGALFAFLQTRIITVKAAPLSMCFLSDDSDVIYVSTLDRHVSKVEYTTGSTLESFKIASTENEDTAVLNSIVVPAQHNLSGVRPYLLGFSSTDKSIRVYDLDKHVLLARESAHTEGITDLKLLEDTDGGAMLLQNRFISTGQDGTIMSWSIAPSIDAAETPSVGPTGVTIDPGADSTATKTSLAALPPLRRVLNKLDFADYVRAPSPRNASRETSPIRPALIRKSSRLALSVASIEETEEPLVYNLRRRASADNRTSIQTQSPSPPPYATRRPKRQTSRPDMNKDFAQRQAESPAKNFELAITSRPAVIQVEEKANKARLGRPPSVPSDLRVKTMESEGSLSSRPTISEGHDVVSDHMRRSLTSYRQRLEMSTEETVPDEVEQELHTLLDTIEARKLVKKANTSTPRRNGTPVRPRTTNPPLPLPDRANTLRKRSSVTSFRQPQPEKPPHPRQNIDNLSELLARTNLG